MEDFSKELPLENSVDNGSLLSKRIVATKHQQIPCRHYQRYSERYP